MDRRSLLDYLADSDASADSAIGRQTAELLDRRLAELEQKLALARAEQPVQAAPAFSSQIESILKRQELPSEPTRSTPAISTPVMSSPRVEMAVPPLAAELPPPPRFERSAEFTRFVEAVHLIGQAANRFLQEPQRPAAIPRQPAGPSEDTLHLTAALRETMATFQSMTSDLVSALNETRKASVAPVAAPEPEPSHPRRMAREDDELLRLQDDLDDLRERLSVMTRGRRRGGA